MPVFDESDNDVRDLALQERWAEAIGLYQQRHGGDTMTARLAIQKLTYAPPVAPAVSQPAATGMAPTDVHAALRAGNKIEAIRLYRARYNIGLAEAKLAVEAIARGETPAAPVVLPAPPSAEQPNPNWQEDALRAVRTELAQGNMIAAIKRYREAFNTGLREAKTAVDAMAAGNTPAQATLAPDDYHHIETLLRAGDVAAAVDVYRQRAHVTLGEAQSVVEAIRARVATPAGPVMPAQRPEHLSDAAIEQQIRAGNLIAAIKLYRERTGLGLGESKSAVEAWASRLFPR